MQKHAIDACTLQASILSGYEVGLIHRETLPPRWRRLGGCGIIRFIGHSPPATVITAEGTGDDMGMTRGALRHVIPSGVPTDVGRSGRWAVALTGLLLAGCANQALERVPASPDVPWRAQPVRDTG
jgi:hypothetical protein